jgi:hypothetical protein
MRLTGRVDKIAGLEPHHLRHHHRQQGVGRDIERFSDIAIYY